MIILFSMLSENTADRKCLMKLRRFLNDEPFVYVSPHDYRLGKNCLHIPLRWDITARFQAKRGSPKSSSKLPNVEVDKHAIRLRALSGQSKTPCHESIVQNYTDWCAQLFKKLQPRVVVAMNPLIPHTQIPKEVATELGFATLAFERGMIRGSLIFDRGGYGGFSEFSNCQLKTLKSKYNDLASHQDRGRAFLKQQPDCVNPRGASIAGQPTGHDSLKELRGCPEPKFLILGLADVNTALIPSCHPERKINSPGYASSYDLAAAVASTGLGTAIFRPHPNMWHQNFPSRPQLRVSVADLEELVDFCDVVVTNGSSLEFFVVAKGKPLVLAGKSVLSGKDIAREAYFPADLRSALESAAKETIASTSSVKNFEAMVGWLASDHLILENADDLPEIYLRSLFGPNETALQRFASLARTHQYKGRSFIRAFPGRVKRRLLRNA